MTIMANASSTHACNTCEVVYSPLLKCAQARFGSTNKCLMHLYDSRKEDDCSICLAAMNGYSQDVYMLSCGHMFHLDCLGKCKKPLCPICRQQMNAYEAMYVFSHSVIDKLMVRIYSMSAKSIEYAMEIIDAIIDIAEYGDNIVSSLRDSVVGFRNALVGNRRRQG